MVGGMVLWRGGVRHNLQQKRSKFEAAGGRQLRGHAGEGGGNAFSALTCMGGRVGVREKGSLRARGGWGGARALGTSKEEMSHVGEAAHEIIGKGEWANPGATNKGWAATGLHSYGGGKAGMCGKGAAKNMGREGCGGRTVAHEQDKGMCGKRSHTGGGWGGGAGCSNGAAHDREG